VTSPGCAWQPVITGKLRKSRKFAIVGGIKEPACVRPALLFTTQHLLPSISCGEESTVIYSSFASRISLSQLGTFCICPSSSDLTLDASSTKASSRETSTSSLDRSTNNIHVFSLPSLLIIHNRMQAQHGRHSGSQGQPARLNTASSLLARILPNQNFEHKMATATRGLKSRGFSYAQYDGTGSSPPQTHERSTQNYISVRDDKDESADELDQIIYADRKSSAGHSLRPRKSLTLSVKAAENGDKTKFKAASVCLSVSSLINLNFSIEAFH
jgi:hypothetical protein